MLYVNEFEFWPSNQFGHSVVTNISDRRAENMHWLRSPLMPPPVESLGALAVINA